MTEQDIDRAVRESVDRHAQQFREAVARQVYQAIVTGSHQAEKGEARLNLDAVRADLRADTLPERRRLFQDVFFTPKGLKALAYLLVRFGYAAPEIVTDRERHLRNAAAILLNILGFSDDATAVETMLKGAQGAAVARLKMQLGGTTDGR